MRTSGSYHFFVLLLAAMVWPGAAFPVLGQFEMGQAVPFTQENGVPLHEIRATATGADGFVWLGSTEGLFRFDGQQFKTWRNDPNQANSLISNSVFSILPEKEEIWVATGMGISVLNIRNDTFRHYQINAAGKVPIRQEGFGYSVNVLYKDPKGNIWVGTRDHGVWRYRPESDDFYQYSYPAQAYPAVAPLLGPPHWVLSLEATGDSIIWAGTPGGLEKINLKTGTVRWFVFPQGDKDYQVNVNAFRRLCYHSDGKLYVGSWMAGVSVFDPEKQTLEPLPMKQGADNAILKSPIAKIISRNGDQLWITALEGFAVYHTGRQEVIYAKNNHLLKREFFGIESIDKAGRLWQGTLNGIQCFDPLMQQFTRYSYEDLHNGRWGYTYHAIPESGGSIIICPLVTDGIYRFDVSKGSWKKYPFTGQPGLLTVRGFTRRHDGVFVIAAEEGLFYWHLGQKSRLMRVKPVPGIRYKRWGDAMTSHDGKVWLCAGSEGIACFDPEKQQVRVIGPERMGGAKAANLINTANLFEDNRGNIWFARNDGLAVYAPDLDTVFSFVYTQSGKNSLPVARSFTQDRRGRIWVVGNDAWVGWANPEHPEAGIMFKMNLADKGITGSIEYITADANGDVWGYNANTLMQINVDNLQLSTYNFQYGVKDVDFFHFSVLPSGALLLGGRNDIVLADPSKLKRNTELPVPYITGIQVLNQPYPYKALFGHEPLYLKPLQNFFSVGFSALAFTLGNETRFRYRLAGFDDWTDAGNRRFANYTNVPGGNYTFQLQAANNEGIWNDAILEIPVLVATAWWATWWFRSTVILAFAALIYGFYRYRVAHIRRKARLKAEYEKKLAHVEMSALLAQMNPHFLFNSLNSIDSYIVKNESRKASEYLNNFARLIRLILQHSRSDYISLADELEALDLYLQMENLRFDGCFDYKIVVDESLRSSSIVIPPMLIQPYLENAIWHGLRHNRKERCEGQLLLKISRQGDYLHCIVEDNGIGREQSAALKAGKSAMNKKKSMGMSITRDRIELINKLRSVDARVEIFDLKDEAGQALGTRVELTIPV